MKNTKGKGKAKDGDLSDSTKDEKYLQPEEVNLELPDVKDIPGQEHVHVPPLGELADTTISSSDEEGEGILDDEDEENDPFHSNVTREEKKALQDAAEKLPTEDQNNLERATLQKLDEDGEPLNEKNEQGGIDLDVPGSEADDENEAIGEEDEENNSYSLGSEDEDRNTDRD